jgi:hypothetical protein
MRVALAPGLRPKWEHKIKIAAFPNFGTALEKEWRKREFLFHSNIHNGHSF